MMLLHLNTVSCLVLLFSCGLLADALPNALQASLLNDTAFALTYAGPLQEFAQLAELVLPTTPPNTLLPSLQLSTPSSKYIVAPNVDTLYSFGLFDLSQNDVLVTIPQVDAGRYWSLAFYDPFGDNFFVVGSAAVNSSTGTYRLQRADSKPTAYPAEDGSMIGVIDSPVTYGILLVRVLVRNNGNDLVEAQNFIKASTVNETCQTGPSNPSLSPLSQSTFADYNSTSPASLLNLTARIMNACPPYNITLDEKEYTLARLRSAGLCDGKYRQPATVNLTDAEALALNQSTPVVESGIEILGNGWLRLVPQGLYGFNYATRAYYAMVGYLANVPSQALYPTLVAKRVTSLPAGQAYLYTFSSKPPLGYSGFWSLTMYNADGYLVANPIDRYSLGDRSNLTYADGAPVYGSSNVTDVDQSFQILVQPTAPPANWTNNWLPSPPVNQEFSVILRFYVPTEQLTDGSWEYPVVTQISALG